MGVWSVELWSACNNFVKNSKIEISKFEFFFYLLNLQHGKINKLTLKKLLTASVLICYRSPPGE